MIEESGSPDRSSVGKSERRKAAPDSASIRDHEAIATLALALVEETDRDGAIRRVLEETRLALRAPTALALLAQPDGLSIDVIGSRPGTDAATRLLEIPPAQSQACASIFQTGEVRVIHRSDPPTGCDLVRELLESSGAESLLAAPLRSRDGILGSLIVGYQRRHSFDARDRRLALTFAGLAAAVIQNARFHEATLRRERRGKIVSQVLAALTATIDADQVPRQLVDVLLHAYGADRAWLLYPCDPEAPSVQIPYEATTPGYAGANALGQSLDSGELDYILRRALESDEPIALDLADPTLPPELRRLHDSFDVKSLITVRFQPRDDRPWLVGLHQCTYARAWTSEEASILAEIAGYAAVAIEHAQLYRRAQEALRVRDEFISSAAHELKTPVTALKGYAQVLMRLAARDHETDGRIQRALLAITHSTDRIIRLTHDLLEVSTFDTYGRQSRRGEVELGELAESVLDDSRVRAGDRSLVCRIERRAAVFGNRDRLADVLYSLIDNAIRYSPPRSTVELVVDALEDEARLSVADQGPGIPEERWPYLFEPLYEPHPVGGTAYVGVVSLGLYLARLIVEEHDGRIWFETEEGAGSIFHIALPLVREEAPAGQATA